MIYDQILSETLKSEFTIKNTCPVAGGCINNTVKCETSLGTFFIKTSTDCPRDFFEKEALGLATLAKHSPINTPIMLHHGAINGIHFLVLEWIEKGRTTSNFWEAFGVSLATQHKTNIDLVNEPFRNQYGFEVDNYIGRLPQSNNWNSSWANFFIEERITPQLSLAKRNGLIDNNLLNGFDRLFTSLENVFPKELPSLLHGDLWSGNFLADESSNPVIYDPATYFGHREMELAFTTLFGGFDTAFYHAYNEAFPIEPGFDERIEIYNLYPLLVHVNLFGTGYLAGIKTTLKRFT